MGLFSYKINYKGSSKVIRRIVDKLNNLPLLGTKHDEAFYGDLGQTAYEHSQQRGNAHDLTLDDLGIGNLPRQVAMLMDSIGAMGYWMDHSSESDPVYIIDHEGDNLMFRSSADILAWH